MESNGFEIIVNTKQKPKATCNARRSINIIHNEHRVVNKKRDTQLQIDKDRVRGVESRGGVLGRRRRAALFIPISSKVRHS
jgi:hypothetical protein